MKTSIWPQLPNDLTDLQSHLYTITLSPSNYFHHSNKIQDIVRDNDDNREKEYNTHKFGKGSDI